MTYDDCLNKISKSKKDDLKYATLVSIVPFFPLAVKLMTRKNNGKKPFSEGFKFDEKVKQIRDIENTVKAVLNSNENETTLSLKLKLFVEILSQTKDEITNVGLKNDFIYMINEVESVIKII